MASNAARRNYDPDILRVEINTSSIMVRNAPSIMVTEPRRVTPS
jgi:hypothetical protein